MLESINFPLCSGVSWENLRRDMEIIGCDGIEGIWAGEEIPADFPKTLLTGYHLTFYPDWLDFYRGNEKALIKKFGSLESAYGFYGGNKSEALLDLYREDLMRALALGADYVVFHVSDVSIEEGYTYRWLHSDEEVIDSSVEIINHLLSGIEPEFDFLVENQWWPGFTFTEPQKTSRLLDGISYVRKGIMLDTGHLMNTNTSISSELDGVAYIHEMLELHGELSGMVRGIHLHQSISGGYVQTHTGFLPADLSDDYIERFSLNYSHIQKIDRHEPWTIPEIRSVIEKISPRYLTHELPAGDIAAQLQMAAKQIRSIRFL